jgi:hypothetical protein
MNLDSLGWTEISHGIFRAVALNHMSGAGISILKYKTKSGKLKYHMSYLVYTGAWGPSYTAVPDFAAPDEIELAIMGLQDSEPCETFLEFLHQKEIREVENAK